MSKKFTMKTFNLPVVEFKELKKLAKKHKSLWLKKPSVGTMLREIATGKIKLSKKEKPTAKLPQRSKPTIQPTQTNENLS